MVESWTFPLEMSAIKKTSSNVWCGEREITSSSSTIGLWSLQVASKWTKVRNCFFETWFSQYFSRWCCSHQNHKAFEISFEVSNSLKRTTQEENNRYELYKLSLKYCTKSLKQQQAPPSVAAAAAAALPHFTLFQLKSRLVKRKEKVFSLLFLCFEIFLIIYFLQIVLFRKKLLNPQPLKSRHFKRKEKVLLHSLCFKISENLFYRFVSFRSKWQETCQERCSSWHHEDSTKSKYTCPFFFSFIYGWLL